MLDRSSPVGIPAPAGKALLFVSGGGCCKARLAGGFWKLALCRTDKGNLTAMLPIDVIHGVEI